MRKRSFRSTLKLTLQHSIGSAHCVGEGLGMRAKQHAPLSHKVGEGLGVGQNSMRPYNHAARVVAVCVSRRWNALSA